MNRGKVFDVTGPGDAHLPLAHSTEKTLKQF